MTSPSRLLLLALISASGAASGCKVGPDFIPPQSSVPPAFMHTGDESFGGPSAINAAKSVDADWWKLLGDPALDTLIQRAAAGNLDVKLAASRLREARAQRGVIAADHIRNST